MEYGIYNAVAKKFQFGIREKTPKDAYKALRKKIGKDANKWRFEARPLPPKGDE